VDDVLTADVDLGVVVAFGRLIRPHVLEAVPMVNLHFSLLPRWRGAAPVERALLAGDDETGVCLMQLEEGLDTGPVYGCERTAIGPEETLDELRGTTVAAGEGALELVEVQPEGRRPMPAPAWLAGARPQPGERLA
jgi:methionyl-tRNA formyltransferase